MAEAPPVQLSDVVTLLEVLEHIHLLTKEKLTALFSAAGLKFGGVNGHLLLTAVWSPHRRIGAFPGMRYGAPAWERSFLRRGLVELFADYYASVRMVYLETEWEEELWPRREKNR